MQKVYIILFVYFYNNVITTTGTPVVNVNIIDFNDEWNYEIKPHSMPLLNGSTKDHILPIITNNELPVGETNTNIVPRTPKKLGDAVRSRVSCAVCKLGVGLLLKEIRQGTGFDDLKIKFVNLCVAFKIESESVCTGVFNVYGPEVVPAFNASSLGPLEICSLALGEVCGDVQNPLHEWNVTFPDVEKPDLIERDLPKPGLPTFKVLHISDTHYDPDYVVGSPANCEEPLCCRNYSTPPENEPIEPAGRWGSYKKCDSPRELIVNMLKNIAEQHSDIDYILWTGDLPPHDIWNQTKENNLNILYDTVEQMFEAFPNTPIFPAIGNHESMPAGNFAPPWMNEETHGIYWLYNRIADQWRRWLPASSRNTVLHGGFYSVLLRPGFRLIALNSNYCHTLSWWLLLNSTDPAKELQWLVHELQEAENNNEIVHLIGHIAPGSSDCLKVWSRNFYSIIERYEKTVVAQFYGHSHADEFEVFYETQEYSKKKSKVGRKLWRKTKNKTHVTFTGRPTNVAYLGPSVTTYDNFNPAYRIYYIDGDHENTTREVLDHETWTTNLEKANNNDEEPEWYRLYSAKDAYKMKSLRPSEWAKLIEQLVDNPNLFELFYKYYYRDSPTRPSCSDSKCKLQTLCDLKSGKSQDRHHLCHELEVIFGI